jgi:hypothetical protein
VPWALRAARAVFVVSALVVLDPARAVHILGEVLDGYRKDGGW